METESEFKTMSNLHVVRKPFPGKRIKNEP